ncbi:MAG: hypothetical protein JRH20_04440 [Deltaproteobacteria bacterium]|nr:hypothetical protein [Deltaproteobacteria bacterium]
MTSTPRQTEANHATQKGRDDGASGSATRKTPRRTSRASAAEDTPKKPRRKRSSVKDPHRRGDYEQALLGIPAYVKTARPAKRPTRQVCGYYLYDLKQDRRGSGWSNTRLSFNLNRSIHQVDGCKFPKGASRSKRAASMAEKLLRKRRAQRFAKGDKVVVNGNWRVTRHSITNQLLRRRVGFMHYSKNHQVPLSNCLSADPKLVCELSPGSTGLPAERANIVHFRMEQARSFQQRSQVTQCRTAAWDALRNLKWAERSSVRSGFTFKTRWNGEQDAKKLKALFGQQKQEALRLFKGCEGARLSYLL